MADGKTVKIFIASSSELQTERKQCVLLLNQLSESFTHLSLKPVEWEYSLVHGNYPGHSTIQSAINPQLKECDSVVFIFHSKIGEYTRQEFEFATANNVRLFVFFKTGFSPKKEQVASYMELLEFKESLNATVMYKEYETLDSFEKQMVTNLSLYLSQTFPATAVTPSADMTTLIKMLHDKELEIKKLRDNPHDETLAIGDISKEIDNIKNDLLQSKEVIEKQAKEKEALEAKLALQQDGDEMKAKALEEIKNGNYDQAEETLLTVVDAATMKVVDTLLELAQVKELQMQYSDALEYAEQALDFEPESAAGLLYAGQLADIVGDTDTAIGYYERNIALEKKSGNDENILAESYSNLSVAWLNKQEYDKAINAAKKAIALYKKLYDENSTVFTQAYETLSDVYYELGEFKKATEYGYKTLDLAVSNYGDDSLEAALAYGTMVMRLNATGDFDKAIACGEKAVATLTATYGEDHPELAFLCNNIGEAYQDKGEGEKAVVYFEKSLAINEKVLPPKHPDILHTKKNLSNAQKEIGRKK